MKTTAIVKIFLRLFLTIVLGGVASDRIAAQTFTPLHHFGGFPVDADNPMAELLLSGNAFYGTASGGSFGSGTIFKINTDGNGYTNIYNFSTASGFANSDGVSPVAGLILSGNTLYGVARLGGENAMGTVFKVNSDGTGFTTLHSFDDSACFSCPNNDGAGPSGALVLSDNTLYGTAEFGGTNSNGTIFKIGTNGSGFQVLHTFSATLNDDTNTDGALPRAGLVLVGNTLYGTASEGGGANSGTVFKISTNGTGFATLHHFPGEPGSNSTNSSGMFPYGQLIVSNDLLYGTTFSGGNSGSGTVFRMSTNGSLTVLHHFAPVSGLAFTNSTGANPYGKLFLSNNTIYGTASSGGNTGNGTVFKLNADGSGFSALYHFQDNDDFTNTSGAVPYGGVVLADNSLFGTTSTGGNEGLGTLFSLSLDSISRPLLTIVRSGTNVVLTWPTNATGFTLQSTTNLPSSNWATAPGTPTVVGDQFRVTNSVAGSRLFYRLRSN